MLTLRRWEPFGELRRREREMDRLWGPRFSQFRTWPALWNGGSYVPMDVYEDADRLTVTVAVPGTKPEELDLTVAHNTLTIKGETKSESEVNEESYLRRERSHGSFRRSVVLPHGLDTDKAEASHEDGVLTIIFPKKEESKPKALKIEVKKALTGKSDK